jgi:hypothetical protein
VAGKFDLENYETVEERLAKFWKAHPKGRVLTKLEFHDERRFIVYAEIYFDREDTTPVSTGYAEEIVGASPVNRTSALENCETSAIGRGLANCGFASIGKRPSKTEMEKVERYKAEPRKPIVPIKEVTQADLNKAKALIDYIPSVQSKEELRRIWDTEKEVLDVKVDGSTLKDVINARAAKL